MLAFGKGKGWNTVLVVEKPFSAMGVFLCLTSREYWRDDMQADLVGKVQLETR